MVISSSDWCIRYNLKNVLEVTETAKNALQHGTLAQCMFSGY